MLNDMKDDHNKSYNRIVSFKTIQEIFNNNRNNTPYISINPTEDIINKLKNTFLELENNKLQCIMSTCYLIGNMLPELIWKDDIKYNNYNMNIYVKSIGLPIGAGLGSSAALSVALSGCIIRLRSIIYNDIPNNSIDTNIFDNNNDGISPNYDIKTIINSWSYASEVVIHGSCSGLDNITSCYGGAVKYSRNDNKFDNIMKLPTMNIIVTNTKVPRSTKILVSKVKVLYDKFPSIVKPILSSIEGISQEFIKIIDNHDKDDIDLLNDIGILFNINHNLLNSLGVGHESLDKVYEISNKYGCKCKLTGAGGGGCAISLLPTNIIDSNNNIINEFNDKMNENGYESFKSKLGGDGIKWHK